jgi:DNA recombination protein RmuC
MIELVLIGLCALAVVLAVALVLACRALVSAKTRLELEIGRRGDQEVLNEARQRALDAQRETLRKEFGELAARLLDDKQRSLASANEHSVSVLFGQLKERLSKYQEEVEKAAGENTRLGEHMKTQLSSLQKFADEAQKFTAALVGGNKLQGNQGEAILAGILEQSGFRRGTHYDMQQGGQNEGRPDASIYDAMNKRIILVDAKMNIKDYIYAYNLPDDEAHKAEKARAIKAHVARIRLQIDKLSEKRYAETVAPTRAGYANLPLVAMFCPFNAVLEAALAEDPTLMQYAFERNIVLVTPLTLWGYLWLVSWGWKQQAIEGQFEEIRKLGGEVLSALDAAVNDLVVMGKALEDAAGAYAGLRKRMMADKGKMSVRRVAKKLMDCGVVPAARPKQIELLSESFDEEDVDAE